MNVLHKRKKKEISRRLNEKSKIKREYAKIKQAQSEQTQHDRESDAHGEDTHDQVAEKDSDAQAISSTDPEPDTSILSQPPVPNEESTNNDSAHEKDLKHRDRRDGRDPSRKRQSKPIPFVKEHAHAERAKQDAAARRVARDEANQQRIAKQEERARFQRAMAKARTGGRNGQRKLGRESKVLLEKVSRLVADGKV